MTDTPQTSLTTNSLDGLVEAVLACKTLDEKTGCAADLLKAKALIEDFISRYNSGRAAV